VWISRRVSRRRSNWLRRASDRALDLVELCLALDREQGDFPAAACLALEGPSIDRRPVDFGRLQQAEGDQPAAAAGADRQQGQAAAAAGDGARCISRELDHGNSLGRRGLVTLLKEERKKAACPSPQATAARQVSIAAARKPRCVDAEVR
jgi:hypothetical protein